MLDLINVSKAYGSQVLLNDASVRLGTGERVGLVGANGSGKTTLFRLIVGAESPDEGAVQMKRGLRIGFLPQEIEPTATGQVLDEVLAAQPRYFACYRERRELEAALAGEPTEEELHRKAYVDLHYQELGGDAIWARARAILGGLGFSDSDLERSLSTLSGGWHMRVRLAHLLLADPELLLLDEPTNHLDLPSMVWFEDYLKNFPGTTVIVAHDREFLNRTVERIVEVDNGRLSQYPGNYDFYRKRKAEERLHQARAFQTQQAKVRDLEDFIARNRVRKDRARQVQSRIKQLEKIDRVDAPPPAEREISFSFPQPSRSGAEVLRVEGLARHYGEKRIFDDVDLVIPRGEKVAILGVNGMGKSTLLKLVAGVIAPSAGAIALGHNVAVGYFAQHQLEALEPGRTVLEEMYTVIRDETLSQVRSLLGAFLFTGDDVEKKVAVLSGGEKSRLALAKLLVRPANFLLMDEPTNHLDIASREVLEAALQQYGGTLLMASHDRRFVDAVATRVWELDDGRFTEYLGNYTDYAWKKAQERRASPGETATGAGQGGCQDATPRDDRKARKRREAELRSVLYREVRPLQEVAEQLEGTIEHAESRIAALEECLADPGLYTRAPDEARGKGEELARLRREVEARMEEWETAALRVEEAERAVRGRFADLDEERKKS